MSVERLEMALAKAEYLLSSTAPPGEGGDKRKFWREILGFSHPEAVREAVLAQARPELLEPMQPNAYGQRYQAIIFITGPSGKTKRIKIIWIVLFGEEVARCVTAVPQRRRKAL